MLTEKGGFISALFVLLFPPCVSDSSTDIYLTYWQRRDSRNNFCIGNLTLTGIPAHKF
jgi:hypothetical protein